MISETYRRQLRDWLTDHGINPNRVPLGDLPELDDDGFVNVVEYRVDDDGYPFLADDDEFASTTKRIWPIRPLPSPPGDDVETISDWSGRHLRTIPTGSAYRAPAVDEARGAVWSDLMARINRELEEANR